ncbi:hypothetical protein [Rhodococcus jostii]|uniref:Uncharacterized protein n=1 Tax=Rhodococcus jostii TaxID=132919 RepID=A0ABU4CT63_RHOJO|nr:hypothetical protein [Rhodococcus jostii]MDV6286755.1 hypothetical protein [Rhodococcus jostii]
MTPLVSRGCDPAGAGLERKWNPGHRPGSAFDNTTDDEGGLRTALSAAFETVDITIIGTVAVFAARAAPQPPKRSRADRSGAHRRYGPSRL